MGTWGTGNFDSDESSEYVDTIAAQLVTTINDCIADPARMALDADGEAVLMPSVDILALLFEHCHATPPSANDVREWRRRYLQVFDEQIDELVLDPNSGYKEERRRIIEDTFRRLEVHAQAFWSGQEVEQRGE